jgi:signal recognition particle receptor subunit beta
MAIVDEIDHAIVLGIVYDGPPEAGKTTSVRALARSFGREVYTPEEQDGRTVYFDWLEHTGGRFDGAPIRCQIVSVPGQERWLERRLHLLQRADVVVFVGDTSASGWTLTMERLHDLRERLDAREGPPVGVVFQANRRDDPDAVAMSIVRERVGSDRVAVIESIALDGTGIREAFVFAVRLALDRVREQQRLGTLPRQSIDGAGEQLLTQLLALDPRATEADRREAPALRATTTVDPKPVSAPAPPSERPQRLPSHEVPSGLIWPPVEGRILLRTAMTAAGASTLDRAGDQRAVLATGHRAQSPRLASFREVEEGRDRLIAWARLHVSAQGLLSKGRCIVLAPAGDGGFRIWQIVRAEPSLRELFVDGCEDMVPRHAARQLASACRLLTEAHAFCSFQGLRLECSLDTIGVSDVGRPIYVGDFPFPGPSERDNQGVELVARELAQLHGHRPADERAELCRELLSFQRHDQPPARGPRIGELVAQLLAP